MTEEAKVESTEQSPELNLADIQNAVKIIDLAARRGAFHAQEMEDIGRAFNRMLAFVNRVAEAQQAQTEDQQSEQAENQAVTE